MHAFQDNKGRTWTFEIHVAAVKRVKALLGIDLFELIEDGFQEFGKLVANPVRLVDVVYVLCKEEADKIQVTDEDFGRSMAGDAIEAAANAFIEEYADFFPDPRVRAGIRRVIQSSRKLSAAMLTLGEEMLDKSDKEIDELNLESVLAKLRSSSGSLPESLASILDPSRSDNST